MLEEIGLAYEAHLVDFNRHDQKTPEFLSLNPNGKIPAILDPDGPGPAACAVPVGAILQYLAEKTGTLLPADGAALADFSMGACSRWAGIGPMFGQVGFFHKFAGKDYEDKRPLERYVAERSACSACWRRDLPGGNGSWTMNTPSPISPCSAGCAIDRVLRRARVGRLRRFQECLGVAGARSARLAVQRGLTFQSDRNHQRFSSS